MDVLGLWDGHDCGAAIVRDGRLAVAVNEERFTRRKLEVGFPSHSIIACLKELDLKPSDISDIAFSTVDFSKTLTRLIPGARENYYNLRRRKISRPRFEKFRRSFKYWSTEIPKVPLSEKISVRYVRGNLKRLGFRDFKIHVVDHHRAHAAGALLTSGFDKCLVVTLDGVGDGLSGTINTFENGEFTTLSKIKARDSFGIFYEQVTTLLGMRELEDEGKVMALSNFAYGIPDEKNKFLDFFKVDGLNVKCMYSTLGKFKRLQDVMWNTPREDVAFMTQRTLEKHSLDLFQNAFEQTGLDKVAISGGVASNIKMNMKVRHLDECKDWFVFPHMGDGGLAAGAALYLSHELGECKPYRLENCYLGVTHDESLLEDSLKKSGLSYEQRSDFAEYAGDIVGAGDFLFWFQGPMEFGPRALGNRSILAPARDKEVKDKLNLQVKNRSWFQPFCPSLIEEDAGKIFSDYDLRDAFMTMGYQVKAEMLEDMASVVNVDASARAQMLAGENPCFRTLIETVKKQTGLGVVLNTSFNIHGYPIVNTADEAISVLKKTKTRYLILEDYVVEYK